MGYLWAAAVVAALVLAFPARGQDCLPRAVVEQAVRAEQGKMLREYAGEMARRIEQGLARRYGVVIEPADSIIVFYDRRGDILVMRYIAGCTVGQGSLSPDAYRELVRESSS